MKKIDTSRIAYWPEDVVFGSAHITPNLPLDILTEDETKAINGFKNANRKDEFLAARHLFRHLVKQLGLEVGSVTLRKEASGKPYALYDEQKVFVSFSHSSQKVFCALSRQHDIGLDVEPVNRKVNRVLLKRILNEQEQQTLLNESPLTLWTIKEAAVKSLGTGLRTNLCDLTIIREKAHRYLVDFNDDKRFEICSFKQSNHQIALAY